MSRVNKHPFFVEPTDAFADCYGESIIGDLFETTELLLAGYLLDLDYEADAVIWNTDDSQPRCHWFFVSTDDLSEDVKAFMTGEARVEPRSFHHAVNTCRAALSEAAPPR